MNQQLDYLLHELKQQVIINPKILQAMKKINRKNFIPAKEHSFAQQNIPLSTGFGQTIFQLYIVILMTQALLMAKSHKREKFNANFQETL